MVADHNALVDFRAHAEEMFEAEHWALFAAGKRATYDTYRKWSESMRRMELKARREGTAIQPRGAGALGAIDGLH
jgi:hypothetical protein